MSDVSLIIIQYGSPELLHSLFQSLDGHEDENLIAESVIVNNGEKLPEEYINKINNLAKGIDKRIVDNEGDSYSSGVNRGVKESSNDILIISNNDVEWIETSSIKPLIKDIQTQKVGLCSPQLVNPNRTYQTTSVPFHSIKSEVSNLLFYRLILDKINKLTTRNSNQGYQSANGYLVGAFIVTRKGIFEFLDGFDEYFDFYGEDVDYCYRVKKAGYDIGINNRSRIVHQKGASSSAKDDRKYARKLVNARIKFVKKHHGQYYSIIYTYIESLLFVEKIIGFYVLSMLTRNSKWRQRSTIMKSRLYSLVKSKERPRLLPIGKYK